MFYRKSPYPGISYIFLSQLQVVFVRTRIPVSAHKTHILNPQHRRRMKNRDRKMGYRRNRQRQQQQHQHHHHQEPLKSRIVLFSSKDRKSFFYQWIWTPIYISTPIVFDGESNQFVYAKTNGLYPFSYGNINYESVFIRPDNFDLAEANISWHRSAEVRSNKRNSSDNILYQ